MVCLDVRNISARGSTGLPRQGAALSFVRDWDVLPSPFSDLWLVSTTISPLIYQVYRSRRKIQGKRKTAGNTCRLDLFSTRIRSYDPSEKRS